MSSSIASAWRLGVDDSVIGYVLRRSAFGTEFAAHLHFELDHLDGALAGLAINIIAIAGGQRKKQQLAAVDAGAEAIRPGSDSERLLTAIGS